MCILALVSVYSYLMFYLPPEKYKNLRKALNQITSSHLHAFSSRVVVFFLWASK